MLRPAGDPTDQHGWAALAVAAGLLLTERALVGQAGTPLTQLRALRTTKQGPRQFAVEEGG